MRLIFCLGGNRRFMALARAAGWWPGARLPSTLYPEHQPLAFADQDWRKFDGLAPEAPRYQRAYQQYLAAVAAARPLMASVIDWEEQRPLDEVLTWAHAISAHVRQAVMLIPKVPGEVELLPETINGVPVVLGFSVPTPHGATSCLPWEFAERRVHLLGGSVQQQLEWAQVLTAAGATITSADGNSFHNGAGFGTYFDGRRFRNDGANATPTDEALRRSLTNIIAAWRAAGWQLEAPPVYTPKETIMARRTPATPRTPAPARAALYLRVSTEDQARDGYGLDVQRARCEAMATVKGWSVAATYADEGISGTKGAEQRPALARLLADVEAGQIDAVIVLALDRLGRKTRIVLDLVERFTSAGVKLVCCKEQIDTAGPYGELMLTIFAAIAQLEHGLIAERTTAGRNVRGLLDGEKGGALPYGYVRTAEGPQIDSVEAETVRYILNHRRSGKSYRAIAEALNARGVPSARGGKWYAPAVKVICDNRSAYQGGQRGQSGARWPAIV